MLEVGSSGTAWPRGESFRQTADVDYAIVVIEALERGRRLAYIAELAFVVVLDDDEVRVYRAAEQLVAAFQGHGHGGRRLMAGRNVNVVTLIQLLVGYQPRFVHRQPDYSGRRQPEYAAGVHVSGILDSDGGLFSEKQIRYQVERVLGADGDQNFIRGCPHASAGQQARVDLFQELWIVAVDAVSCPSPNGADAECSA